jgi:cellulose synthase/poly-beta-1,6-N-acetylglucosamine synthase-like glycosyltransferase
MTPRVSVLVPAFQAESTIDLALASVARQSEASFECIVVDDGSSDRTREIADRRAANDPRFVVVAAPHRGIVPALEEGIVRCTAPIVARFDADDVMHRDRLREQLALFDADPSIAAAGTRVRLFPRRTMMNGLRTYERWLNAIESPEDVRREAFIECPIAHPTLAVRRSVLDRFRYRDRGWPEDYDLVLRMIAEGLRLAVVPKRLHLWRDGPTRLSRVSSVYALDAFVACKAAFLSETILAAGREYVLWGHGPTGRKIRRALLAHGKHASHVVEIHPRRIGQRIGGAPVISPETLLSIERVPVVTAVSGESAREMIRGFLSSHGYRESTDYVCAA